MTCECCGAECAPRPRPGGLPKRFCSRRCAARFNDRGPDPRGRVCGQCGGPIPDALRAASRFCSDSCRRKGVERPYSREAARARSLARKFKLTPERLAELLDAQGGRCAICRGDKPGGRGDWHVDHDHGCCPGRETCGRCIRGVLCSRCNVGMGYFGDDPDQLMAAVAYLLATRDVLAEVGR